MLTLEQIIKKIWSIAEKQPNINTIVRTNDIYQLNADMDVKYAAFCVSQLQHTQNEDFIYFNFNLFYADRLRSDKGNQLEVQSHAISVLKNIIATLMNKELLDITQITYTPFQQRFESETAGAYATITIAVPIDELCEEDYN